MRSRKPNSITAAMLPSQVVILGHTLPVIVKRLKPRKGEVLMGYFDTITKVIYVDTNQSLSQAEDTLFHEALHAAFELSGVVHLCPEASDLEETIIRLIATTCSHAVDLHKLGSPICATSLLSSCSVPAVPAVPPQTPIQPQS